MKNKWVVITVALVIVAALAITGSVYYMNANGYVAKVAGEKVTKAEYNFMLNNVKLTMEQTANVTDENSKKTFWESSKDGKSIKEVAKEQALDRARELKIQLAKAKQANVALDNDDKEKIKKSIDDMVKQAGDKIKADKMIKEQYGVNRAEFENIYKEFMLASKFAQQQEKNIKVSDEELKKYFDENKQKERIGKVTVKHILISTVDQNTKEPLPQDKQDEAKKKADDILAKVKAGGDFAALAKEFSEDPGSKEKGGEYTFGTNEMVKEFEDWSYAAKPGDTGIVKTSYGYHIMKFEKWASFDESKEEVKGRVMQDKYIKQMEEWKKEPQYSVEKNQKVYDAIPVI